MLNFLFFQDPRSVNSATQTGKGKHSCSPDWCEFCQIYMFSDLLIKFVLQFRACHSFQKKQENVSLCRVNFVMIGQWSGTEKHRERERDWIAWIMESYEERAGMFIPCSTQRPFEQMENSLSLDEVVEFLWFVKHAGRFTLWLVH